MKRLRIVCALTSIAALGGIGDGLAAIHTSDACVLLTAGWAPTSSRSALRWISAGASGRLSRVRHRHFQRWADVLSVPDDATTLVRQTSQCAGTTEVTLFEIRGGGHTWPLGEPYLGERLVGRVSRELDANEALWEFFARHRG
jgi:poly(3-hydroxybutyrate) depolymerase